MFALIVQYPCTITRIIRKSFPFQIKSLRETIHNYTSITLLKCFPAVSKRIETANKFKTIAIRRIDPIAKIWEIIF